MNLNVGKEVAALRRLSMDELRAKYAELFGDEARTINKMKGPGARVFDY